MSVLVCLVYFIKAFVLVLLIATIGLICAGLFLMMPPRVRWALGIAAGLTWLVLS